MAQITLAKALKIKNRLTGRLAKVQADIQAFNSVPVGQADQVNVLALMKTREELVGALVSLKTAVNDANRQVQRDIYDLAEKKATAQFLAGVSTRHGPQPPVYPSTIEVNYVAALKKADVDALVVRLEKAIGLCFNDQVESYRVGPECTPYIPGPCCKVLRHAAASIRLSWRMATMTAEQLGETRRDFKPGVGILIAGIIIGLMMIGFGCAAIFDGVMKAQKGGSWGAAATSAAIGIGLVIGGIFLIRWVRSLFSFRVRICENGFLVIDKKTERVFGWDNLLSVQERQEYVAMFKWRKIVSKSYSIKVKDGKPFAFGANTIKGHAKLAKMIKEETDRRNIPWEIVEYQAQGG